jgi:hypothetical protein
MEKFQSHPTMDDMTSCFEQLQCLMLQLMTMTFICRSIYAMVVETNLHLPKINTIIFPKINTIIFRVVALGFG